jgi:alpha-galactosidase
MKAKLWWAPMAADPGSKILKDDPLVKLINKDGAPQYITWWNSYYMSPAYEGTLEHTKETIEMFMEDWGFDGLKLDGQHMNAVPADYNWKRPLEYPEKSIEMLPDFFELIYHTAREIKHDAVVENCPCGTCMSYYNMPYTNQFVSSDPLNSWQIRLKGKTYKALAPGAAYYGDHVELSDNGTDFATSFGIGAVLGTKFTWPKNNPNVEEDYLLTPEKEKIWKKWFGLYDKMMLSKGDYLGDLYDIGYDKPEAHVIRKDGKMYYAFYSEEWDGDVEFKGLNENANYRVYDYFNDTEVAEIAGNSPIVKLKFKEFMVLSLTPVE